MEPGNEATHACFFNVAMLTSMYIHCNKLCLFVPQLLEACVSNCGRDFQLELTKPSFHSDVRAILTGVRGSKFY